MLNSRILVASYDKSANQELAKSLSTRFNGLVQPEHEFQKAIETADKYRWLDLFFNLEDIYRQLLIVLWFNRDVAEKRNKIVSLDDEMRLLDYCNEVLFEHYSIKNRNTRRTRVFLVNMGAKVKYQEVSLSIMNSISNDTVVPTSVPNPGFRWNFPDEIVELVR